MLPSTYKKMKMEKLKAEKQRVHTKISNTFIESAIKNNSLAVLKTIYYVAAKVRELKEFDEVGELDLLRVEFSANEFFKETGIKPIDISRNLKKIQETSISFINEKEKYVEGIALVPYFKYMYGKNKVAIHIYKRIADLIVAVQQNYSFVNTQMLMNLKSKHTMKFLPLLMRISQYSDKVGKRKHMTLGEVNEFFGTNYTSLNLATKYIFEPVKRELDQNSKISFLYETEFELLGAGRPKATGITIDVINQDNNLFVKDLDKTKTPMPEKLDDFKEFVMNAYAGYALGVDTESGLEIYTNFDGDLFLKSDENFKRVSETKAKNLWQKLFEKKYEVLSFVLEQQEKEIDPFFL